MLSVMTETPRYRVVLAKEDFKFSAAHFTLFPDGSAELLHGHNYHVAVEVGGMDLDEYGMLCDFVRLKTAIREICERLDSCTLIPSRSPHISVVQDTESVRLAYGHRRYRLPREDVRILDLENTTIELLAALLWQELAPKVRDTQVSHLGISVAETAGQSCWFRSALPQPAGS